MKALIGTKVVDWYDLGLQLDIDDSELMTIQHMGPQDNRRCVRDMFRVWLQNSPNPTYKQLVDALVAIGQPMEAERLCIQYGEK